jgi:hypothetical protein
VDAPMTDRSPVWIGTVDMALAVLAVVIVAVNPPTPKAKGVEMKAEILATIEWDVNTDADVDIHMMPPSHKPVFYGSRDVGCATLDRDNRGFLDSVITLADGSQTKVESDKETIAIRCVEPGRYDLAANLYEYRINHFGASSRRDLGLRVHVEILALNPQVRVLFAKDIVLDYVGQTINWASFDMSRDGSIALVDPPLAPVTSAYQKRLDAP